MATDGVLSWTQPICDTDWTLSHPDRFPVRVKDPEQEQCAYCGNTTDSGIYVRDDPTKVKYPAKKKYA
jgi:hypothetical protein